MAGKDYYRILNVSPAASPQEIKKAFRALAHRYHPDKNKNNPLAAAHFGEIQEAYLILSDADKRKAWHYDHYHAAARNKQQGPVTPDFILLQCRQLQRGLLKLNPYRIDHDVLSFQIKEILSPYHLAVLQHSADTDINTAIVQELLAVIQLLPFRQMAAISPLLTAIDPVQPDTPTIIKEALNSKKQQWIIDRYKIPAALLITIVLLIVILLSQT